MKTKSARPFRNIIATAILIGVAVLGLATINISQAEERYRQINLTNPYFPTVYSPSNGVVTLGLTNTALANGAAGVSNTLASVPYAPNIFIGDLQGQPFYWVTAAAATANQGANSNLVIYLDASPDGNVWTTNHLYSQSTLLDNGSTNWTITGYPVTNGTNALSPYKFVRWTQYVNGGTNGTYVLANYLQVFK